MELKCCAGFRLKCFVIILLTISPCVPYNLETRLPLFKYGMQDSKFGFSVALHRTSTDESDGVSGTLLVAGAPTAPASGTPDIGRMPTNPGGVFYCPVTTSTTDCSRVTMDKGGDVKDDTTGINHVKSNQWLGVSLKSQGPGQYLLTCAHRYTQQLNLETQNEKERVCGKCFLMKSGPDGIEEIAPNSPDLPFEFVSSLCEVLKRLQNSLDSKLRYGKAQAGTSIAIHDGKYVLGAPGTWAWTGALFDFNLPLEGAVGSNMAETPTCTGRDRRKNEFGSWHCSKIPLRRDSYMGFSVATSSAVNTDSDRLFYAAGAPVGNHTGGVVFFEKSTADDGRDVLLPDLTKTVLGDKIGSSFGYSIALTDVNGDDLDDLLVGAPQYYEYSQKKKVGGALYVYLNEPDKDFSAIEPKLIFGPLESYFGHSIAPLGDLDQDGYNDFAVGAPYENENGTVHIFRGGPNGPKKSQEIKGSDYAFARANFKEIVGFGASLSGSVDSDSNKYPDLLIGTLSDSIVLLRSRPIITVTSSLDVQTEELDLELKTCSSGGQAYACFRLSYCLTYKARHANYPGGVAIEYTIKIDNIRQAKEEPSRLHFDSPSGRGRLKKMIMLPRADNRVCPGNTHDIYFDNDAADKLTDIEIKFEFELDQPEVRREREGAPVFDLINDPILDADVENEKTSLVRIKNTCGDDGCQSGLKISASMPKEVVVGVDSEALLVVNVMNDGEEAHQAYIDIYLPPNLDFLNFSIPDQSTPGMSCHSAPSGLSSFVRCKLGNPYNAGMKDTIKIHLSTLRLDARTKTIDVTIEGHTTSVNPDIQPIELQAQVIIELSLSLTWSSQPDQVRYAEKPILGETGMETTEDIGPLIQYTFNVENTGLATASGVILKVDLPIEIDNGKWLLYLVASDVEAGGDRTAGTCNSSQINLLQLEPALPVAAAISSRSKRSAETSSERIPFAEASSVGSGYVSTIKLSCDKKTARCQSISCAMDEIPAGTTTSVVMQIHVWEPTFLEEFKTVDLVSVYTEVKLTTEDKSIRVKDGRSSGVVETIVDHEEFKSDVAAAFPWWYILIGVIILFLIYIVIIVLLVKCGFFRRKKYPRDNEIDNTVLVEEEEEEDDENKNEEDKI